MKRHLGFGTFGNLVAGSALVVLAAQPARAAATVITGVEVNSTDGGMQLVMQTRAGTEPQIFTISQNNTLRADIIHARLNLPGGESFSQSNPAPGIDSITVSPLDANSVRVTVNGTNTAPASQGESFTGNRLSLNFNTSGQTAQAPTAVPNEIQTVPGNQSAPQVAQDPGPAQTQQNPDVLVPNPEVTIDGVVVPRPQQRQAPPFMPRAVAPPVGDIAVSSITNTPLTIDLGTAERVPRLLLRDAPTREVLNLLARSAGLNLAFTGQEDGGSGPRISLDIENEPVQDVFNYVLRLSGLQANRVGRTIFVGAELPGDARNTISRTLRMNQVDSSAAAAFLAALGAESTQTVTAEQTEVTSIATGVEGAPPISTATTTTRTQIEALTYEAQNAVPVLRGMQVIADSRLNSVTLVGESRLVELASEYLVQLDLRRRQVAVNVKIVDVDLQNNSSFGSSFSFGVAETAVTGTAGTGIINFGNTQPSSSGALGSPPGAPTGANLGIGPSVNVIRNLLLQLQARVVNDTAKVLTDPTLIIQEGQTASISLTQDVIVGVQTSINPETGAVTSIEPELEEAGLILSVQVNRIDDNGFVSMNVSPSISAPGVPQGFITPTGTSQQIFPLQRRQFSSGQIRLRDAQTLILSGIIQESERTTASRIPILGDLPIIGALFRSTSTQRERAEVIVLLTPQILDDSDQSVWGYGYTPSEDVQELLDRSQRR